MRKIGVMALVGFLVAAAPAVAEEPTILVLRLIGEPASAQREDLFIDELKLALNGFVVQEVRPEDGDFAHEPLARQITVVEPLVEQEGAVAAVWLSEIEPGRLLLHLVVLSTGRALIRLLETTPEQGFEADLAVAASELLGTAFLFEAWPSGAPEPLGEVVATARDKAAMAGPRPITASNASEPASPDARVEPGRALRLNTAADLEGGLLGGEGARWFLGALVSLEYPFVAGLHGRASFGFLGGPLDDMPHRVKMHRTSLTPSLGVLYLWRRNGVALGPSIDFQARWSFTSMQSEGESAEAFRTFQARGSAALELRLRLFRAASLSLAAGFVATPAKDTYRLQVTREVVFDTWYWGLVTRLGILIDMRTSR